MLHGRASRDRIDYDARHVLPFLADALVAYPRDLRLGWFGSRKDLLARFAVAWAALGFQHPIQVAAGAAWLGPGLPDNAVWAPASAIGQQAQAFVFDFGMPLGRPEESNLALAEEAPLAFVADGLRAMALAEDRHLLCPTAVPRRFIGVNAVHNQWEGLIGSVVGAASAPLATRLRQGLRHAPASLPRDILPQLQPGAASRRTVDGIRILPGRAGQTLRGPPMLLLPGAYRLRVRLERDGLGAWLPGLLQASVYAWPRLLTRRYPVLGPGGRDIVLDFTMPPSGGHPQSLELRLTSLGAAAGIFTRAWLAPQTAMAGAA